MQAYFDFLGQKTWGAQAHPAPPHATALLKIKEDIK